MNLTDLITRVKGKIGSHKLAAIIPARIGSDEIHAKVLLDLGGKPVIQRVYEAVKNADLFHEIILAVDHQRIVDTVNSFGGKPVLTKKPHICGSDRCAEAVETLNLDADIVVNVQADEPFLNPNMLFEVVEPLLEEPQWDMATLCCPFIDPKAAEYIFNVKVVKSEKSGRALYFSRSLIPYPRSPGTLPHFQHIGVYAYRKNSLLNYAAFGPSSLELRESLEQLRALENGFNIKVVESNQEYKRIAINTAQDLEQARALFK